MRHRLLWDASFRRILRNYTWLIGGNGVSVVAGFIQAIVLARILGPRLFGVLALVTTIVATVNQLVDSRVWETAITYIVRYRAREDVARARAVVKLCYLIDLLTGIGATALVLMTAELAARTFVKDDSATGLIVLFSLSVMINIPTNTSSALLRVADAYKLLSFQNAAVALLRLGGILLLAQFGVTLRGVLVVYLVSAALGSIFILIAADRASSMVGLRGWPGESLSGLRRERRELTRFMITSNGNALLKLLHRNMDALLLGAFLTPAAVGLFRVARGFSDLMDLPASPMYTAIYPEVIGFAQQRDMERLRSILRRWIAFAGTIATAGFVATWILGEQLVSLTAGPQFLGAVAPLRWLVLGAGLVLVATVTHPVLVGLGRPGLSLITSAAATLAKVSCLLLLVGITGVVAAGMSHVALGVVWLILGAIFVKVARQPAAEADW